MNMHILTEEQKRILHEAIAAHAVESCIAAIAQAGGKAYLVGGACRDIVLGLPIVDLDIEVHQLSYDELSRVLSSFGAVNYVGKAFGVLKWEHSTVDWSLPRVDESGRKPTVHINPQMGLEESLRRRDLTMNALAIDLHMMGLIDPFNGVADIKKKILRSPDVQFFAQDPLRFYRVLHFIARFEMYPDDALTQICKTMDVSAVSLERISAEYEKLFLKSKRPSIAFRWLGAIERLEEILPELYYTIFIPQQPEWHPEGVVFEHLMQAIDAAVRIPFVTTDERLLLCFAALCHDLGKVSATSLRDGKLRAFGHAQEGVPFARRLLKRMTNKKYIISPVLSLVYFHMHPFEFERSHAGLAAYKRLAVRLNGLSNLEQLSKLVVVDRQARNGSAQEPLSERVQLADYFCKHAQEAGVLRGPEKPLIQGRDLIAYIGSGKQIGDLMRQAYELQINEHISSKEELIKRVLGKRVRSSLTEKK